YSLDGACTNWAEEYFSRFRRAEIGIHHHIAGSYLLRYAQESSWREDNRRVSNGDQVSRVAALAMKRGMGTADRLSASTTALASVPRLNRGLPILRRLGAISRIFTSGLSSFI